MKMRKPVIAMNPERINEIREIPEEIKKDLMKKKKKKRIKPIPRRKWCQNCMKHRVKFHHYYCQWCYDKVHKTPQEKIEIKDTNF